MRNNVVVNFAVLTLTVVAGILLLKLGVSYLPDDGILGSIKMVVKGV